MGLRRKSRELFVQTFYALLHTDTDQYLQHLDYINKYEEILSDLAVDNEIANNSSIYKFAESMLKNIFPKIDEIDEVIHNNIGEYKVENLGMLEMIILRMAIYEILFEKTPAAVVINEAVEITKKYCAEKSPSLLNAILDKIHEKEDKE